MSIVTLIRHGESVWNGERRIQGTQDPPLSPLGRRQAELLVAELPAHLSRPPAAVFTSPLRRAAETAERIGAAFRVPVIPDPDLCEIRLGTWEGMTVPEIQAAFPGRYERWLADPAGCPAPGGEALGTFAARTGRAQARGLAAYPDADLIVVSHGGVIRSLLCRALGLDVRHLFRVKQDNTAVSQIEVAGDLCRVLLLNDTCHLSRGGVALAARDVLTDTGGSADTAV
ncbi:MAG TPA: histidine phosphatase family protein [Candidatus Sulfotelmatobacter sp.]|nr:histidine phosphatase family protein [Candidatus Sulfotelmatobacter sp.]